MKKRLVTTPRTLQEWMETRGVTSQRLLQMVRDQTGRDISPTMFSFILRGSRRCSLWNATALNAVTGVPIKTLTEWPRISQMDKSSVGSPKRVA
jgi:hypothetical protein